MWPTRCPNVFCPGVGRKSYFSAGISSAPAGTFFAICVSSFRAASVIEFSLGEAACCPLAPNPQSRSAAKPTVILFMSKFLPKKRVEVITNRIHKVERPEKRNGLPGIMEGGIRIGYTKRKRPPRWMQSRGPLVVQLED